MNIVRLGNGSVRLEFELQAGEGAPSMVGDWNGWDPVPLTRGSSGCWTVELPLTPGVYKYALVRGDMWTVSPAAPSVPDEFGGRVGILVIR